MGRCQQDLYLLLSFKRLSIVSVDSRKTYSRKKEFLCSLSLDHEEGGVCWVHDSPHKPKFWHYVTLKPGVGLNCKSFEAHICFVEYTHKPVILEQTPDGEVKDNVSNTWNIKKTVILIMSEAWGNRETLTLMLPS